MTYQYIEKYLTLEPPTESEVKAYDTLEALRDFKGFSGLWSSINTKARDDMFNKIVEVLDAHSGI